MESSKAPRWPRTAASWILLLCALSWAPHQARAQDFLGLGMGLGSNALGAGKTGAGDTGAPTDAALVPVCIIPDQIGPRPTNPSTYDVAVVPLSLGKGREATVYEELNGFLKHRGVRVAPSRAVSAALATLGLASSRALCPPEYAELGRLVSSRFLLLVTVRQMKASRQLGLGSALLAVGRIALFGAFVRGHSGGAILAGAAGLALLLGGISTTATCDIAAQLFDTQLGKTRWVESKATTRKKNFLGIAADKAELSAQARRINVEQLFLAPARLIIAGRTEATAAPLRSPRLSTAYH